MTPRVYTPPSDLSRHKSGGRRHRNVMPNVMLYVGLAIICYAIVLLHYLAEVGFCNLFCWNKVPDKIILFISNLLFVNILLKLFIDFSKLHKCRGSHWFFKCREDQYKRICYRILSVMKFTSKISDSYYRIGEVVWLYRYHYCVQFRKPTHCYLDPLAKHSLETVLDFWGVEGFNPPALVPLNSQPPSQVYIDPPKIVKISIKKNTLLTFPSGFPTNRVLSTKRAAKLAKMAPGSQIILK